MAKQDKAQSAVVGRVPLVMNGKPLLYPRYSNIEELLNIGKDVKSYEGDVCGNADAGGRPNKKQKRAAAGQDGGDQAAGKGYGVIGEDGLTYKQRRQLRRAEERAAKERAAAEAAKQAGPANEDANIKASEPQAPITEARADANGKADKEERKKEKKNKRARKEEEDGFGGAAPSTGLTAKGNAGEAEKMRAVLGFTSTASGNSGGGGGSRELRFATLAAGAATAAVENPDDDVAARPVSEKKQTRDKKRDKKVEQENKTKHAEVKQGGGSSQKRKKSGNDDELSNDEKEPEAGIGQQQEGGTCQAESQRANPAGKVGGKTESVACNSKQPNGAGGGKVFSFDFQVQASVEAETEARVARLMALDSTKDGFVPRRIWVSGLPHEFDEETIREYWGYCGEVESMHLLTFPDSGNFNGTAYITFKTQEAYEAALACNGEMLEGRALRVEKCKVAAELKGKARASTVAAAASKADTGVKGTGDSNGKGRVAGYPVAYCGNIAFEVGVEELQQLFSGAGVVPTQIRLHVDKASGRSKGYAHVHFVNDEDVEKAVALDGTSFHGRKIRVSYAQPKPGEV
ncbi:hypothetical protein Vretimale_11830 [Volvox reticuliferus]|uniref:RRM domain-containing protein n=1 Tax=Volvox reticuliferus TaxID=1737510 RepID=A0A8J4CG81_9CHLO|nr:hypothetical protein Vretifemale_11286 [Volvox reticuliferus]GIM07747.1 hypothetical protein Vretimale_11830 [Volvox reticuliferus]